LFPVTNDHKSHQFTCSPYSDKLILEKNDDQERQEFTIPPIDTLPDSLWLKRFVLDEPQEYLPPIARAMKNMLDNDMLIWNSEIQKESTWPHFINQYRTRKNKTSLRNLQGNNAHQSSSKYATDKKIPETGTRITTSTDQQTPEKMRPSKQRRKIPKNSLEQLQNLLNISRLVDCQSLLKPPELSSRKHKNNSTKLKEACQ
jgi:hypothetical protein